MGLVTAVTMAAADEEASPLCISDLLPPRDDDIRSLVADSVPVVTGCTSSYVVVRDILILAVGLDLTLSITLS